MLPAIKTFTREAQESARYRERIGRVMDLTVQQVRVNAALGPVIQALPLVRRAPLARTAPACGT